jgi:hypothetical protein
MDIQFDVVLTPYGHRVLDTLIKTQKWSEVAKAFPHVHEFDYLASGEKYSVTFPFAAGMEEGKSPFSYNFETREWKVACRFKYKWPINEAIRAALPFLVAKPTTMRVWHDLWEGVFEAKVEPKKP